MGDAADSSAAAQDPRELVPEAFDAALCSDLVRVVQQCEYAKVPFTDGAFLPHNSVLDGVLKKRMLADVQWQRLAQIVRQPVLDAVRGATGSSVLQQGKIADCWVIGPLNAISQQPNVLKAILAKCDDYREQGIYKFRFYRDGAWENVLVDDYVPVIAGRPLFVTSRDGTSVWPLMLEKAYAKLYGSYLAINEGTESVAFVELTARCTLMFHLRPSLNADVMTEQWNFLLKNFAQGALMTTTAIATAERVLPRDLVGNHSYTVLEVREHEGKHRLLRLCNPWGDVEWTGDWSPKWDGWTPKLQDALGEKRHAQGSFWMAFSDFFKYFSFVCMALTPLPEKTIVQGEWTTATAAGWIRAQRFFRNPQHVLQCPKADSMVQVIFEKPDTKVGGFWILELPADMPPRLLYERDNVLYLCKHMSDISNRRSICYQFKAKKGVNYVLIPFLLAARDTAKYTLTMYSSTPLQADLLKPKVLTSEEGEFALSTTGGTPYMSEGDAEPVLNANWARNPQYLLRVPTACDARIRLYQDIEYHSLNAVDALALDGASLMQFDEEDLCHIGFCVLRGGERAAAYDEERVVACPDLWRRVFCFRQGSVGCAAHLEPGAYVVVLNTASKKERAAFTLEVETDTIAVSISELD